jgi:hypothetical protein
MPHLRPLRARAGRLRVADVMRTEHPIYGQRQRVLKDLIGIVALDMG